MQNTELRTIDYDRYLSLIFSPKEKRDDLLSVILFNLEIARIKARVTEPMIGMIRLQWWREAIDEVFDNTRLLKKHDVAVKLRSLANKYKLNKEDFLTIINAREKDLDQVPFPTLADFNTYTFDTSYPVNKIMLDILGVNDIAVIEATKEISKAWAICAILRSAYKNYSAGRAVFPQDLAGKYNLDITLFGKYEFLVRSKELVKELANIAEAHVQKAQQILSNASAQNKKAALPVLLNLTAVKHHLKQIRKNRYDIFTRTLNPYLGVINLIKIYLGLV